MNEAANDSARVSGQDRKIPPALGTNQIAGFGGFRPLASLEKSKKAYSHLVRLVKSKKTERDRREIVVAGDMYKIVTVYQ